MLSDKQNHDGGDKKNNVQNNVKPVTNPTGVFVSNLLYSVKERNLREVFSYAGRVVMVDLYRDKEGKSQGQAVVEYFQPEEAKKAIYMFNGQTLFDRKMTVRFDQKPSVAVASPSGLPKGLGGVGPKITPKSTPTATSTATSTATPAASGGGKAPRKKVKQTSLK